VFAPETQEDALRAVAFRQRAGELLCEIRLINVARVDVPLDAADGRRVLRTREIRPGRRQRPLAVAARVESFDAGGAFSASRARSSPPPGDAREVSRIARIVVDDERVVEGERGVVSRARPASKKARRCAGVEIRARNRKRNWLCTRRPRRAVETLPAPLAAHGNARAVRRAATGASRFRFAHDALAAPPYQQLSAPRFDRLERVETGDQKTRFVVPSARAAAIENLRASLRRESQQRA
jgi:hypothetical protein